MNRKYVFIPLALTLFLSSMMTSCIKDDENDPRAIDSYKLTVPTLTTDSVTNITQFTAFSGGKILTDGGSSIITKGICWSTSQNPTIQNSNTMAGSGASDFTSGISGLSLGTTYYVRAFAKSNVGTGYGQQVSFTTINFLTLGLHYAGGIVFYLDSSSIHGLACADTDQSVSAIWGCPNIPITGADAFIVGSGWQNTIDIISDCNSPGCAADICENLVMSSDTDWFLPSKNELLLMYNNLNANGQGNFTSGAYWSSTEMTSVYAWEIIFNSGIVQGGGKSNLASVRAVRKF